MTTEGASISSGNPGPLGRDAVVSAVLTHAADLFAERGPNATSIRDIAERAGVNHGLVFRHFGAKDKLVTAVLDHLAAETGEFAGTGDFSPDDPRLRRHWTVLARCILDGYPVGRMQSRFPVIQALTEQARAHHTGDTTAASLAVAHVAAFVLGWQLFEPFLRGAADLESLPDTELRRAVGAEALRILHGPS